MIDDGNKERIENMRWMLSLAINEGAKRPMVSVADWADANYVLDPISSSEPGRWNTDRTPYLREPMDRLSVHDPIKRVVLLFGAQLGKTSAGLAWIGYQMDCEPGPFLAIQPTYDLAKSWSKNRLATMISASDVLLAKVGEPRSRDSDNTILEKIYPGGVIYMAGANSPVGLRSKPVRYLFLDEIDNYPGDVAGEGDPVALAEKRLSTYGTRSKCLLTSTPTIKGASRIEAAYLETDQRKYYVPCIHCGFYQVLTWSGVRWNKDNPNHAWYECVTCQGKIENWHKTEFLPKGEWCAQASANDVSTGYQLSGLYSPHGWVSWCDMMHEYLSARQRIEELKTWINTRMGDTWDDRSGHGVDEASLLARTEDFSGELDPEVRVLTMGVDVQDDRIEIETVAWGPGYESWSVDYTVLRGDPSDLSVKGLWADLDRLRNTPFQHPIIGPMVPAVVCVDTGGHYTQSVYLYTGSRYKEKVYGIKGLSTHTGKKIPIWPKKPTKKTKTKTPLFMVGVDAAKEDIMSRLRITNPGMGYCHYPKERDEEYFKQLTAERVQTTFSKTGHARRVWVKRSSARAEALDCRVYAYAALHAWLQARNRLDRPLEIMLDRASRPVEFVGQEEMPAAYFPRKQEIVTERKAPKKRQTNFW